MFNVLSEEDTIRLLNNAAKLTNPDVHDAIVIILNTGLRIAELASLRWSDVDLARDVITIQDKTTGQKREIPIWPEVRNVIDNRAPHSDFVIERVERVRIALRRLGCPIHALRNTFAMNLRRAGLPLDIMSRLLGHSDVRTTARLFPYLTREDQAILKRRNGRR